MESKIWLKEKLSDLAAEFNGTEFKYGYEKLSETHFVSVAPGDLMSKDESFNLLRFDLLKDFYTHYPYESIVFLSIDEEEEFADYEDVISGSQPIDDCLNWLNALSTTNIEIELSRESQTNSVIDSDYALAA